MYKIFFKRFIRREYKHLMTCLISQVIFRINYEQKLWQKIFVHKTINYIYVFLALYNDLKNGWHSQPNDSYLLFIAKSRHLAGLAILDPVHLCGKYRSPLPRRSWMTCKRGQSPRYLQPFCSWNNGKFPANAPLCSSRRGVGVYTDWCINLPLSTPPWSILIF